MELRQLQYAVMLAEERNFSRAAEKLHLAQPSLSQQIIKLEKELGVSLFERRPGDILLTFAGKRFIDQASKIIDQVELLKKEMQDVANTNLGQLVIGSLPITGAHILPPALPLFQQEFPGVELVLVEETTSNLEVLTSRGQTDISLLSMPISNPELEIIPLLEEEIVLAVPPGHFLAEQGIVSLAECQQEAFIFLKKGQGFREISEGLCRQAGFEPKVVFESTNIETVQSLVAAGMGVAFIPQMVTRTRRAHVPVYLSICDLVATRTLVIAYKKGRYLSKAATSFISMLKSVVEKGDF
ncbi:MAG TPA: LysR family transcriptional regulator [Bacillota bacterium]|nr:LysR family transcriptional regulator [Bacillota bacterium]